MANIIAGELEQLRPNFYRLCAPNPGPMTGPGTNTYLYGSSELAVFDPGPAIPAHVDAILKAQETLGAKITRLFASHTHNDHSPAVSKLQSHLGDVQVIGLPAPEGQLYEDMSFKPTHQPFDGEGFEIEGQIVRAVHTPGHVENHYCYLFEEHNLLTTGDHLMNGSTVVIIPPKGSMKDYVESLEKLLNFDIDVMAPGHGDLIDNPVELVRWTVAHRLERETKVLAALSTHEARSIEELVPEVYADTKQSLHAIAALSLHAHLIKLQVEGRALCRNDAWQAQA